MRVSRPFDRRSWLGSLVIHAVALAAVLYTAKPAHPLPQFETYEIHLVSPPPARVAVTSKEARQKLVVEHPTPAPPAEEKTAPVVKPPPEKTVKKAAPRSPPRSESVTQTGTENKAAASPDAKESKSKESGEGVNVRLEGLKRDYPAYYNNIVVQITRCFQALRPADHSGDQVTVISFVIKHDGSVTDPQISRKSGDAAFDYLAMGAVECAGKGRLGPLPKDLPYDQLPVQFTFQPAGGGGGAPQPPEHPSRDPKEQVRSR
jgi:TonB C terminal